MGGTQEYCDMFSNEVNQTSSIKYQVWFGEWTLAADTCKQWIEGFNDGYTPPPSKCIYTDCPKSYLPAPWNVDFNRQEAVVGPYGSGWPSVTNINNG